MLWIGNVAYDVGMVRVETAVQAARLQPASTFEAAPYSATHQSNPFLMDVDFLGTSAPLGDVIRQALGRVR